MEIIIRCYDPKDVTATMSIWNEVVRDGIAFPQVEELTLGTADDFFRSLSYTGVAEDTETGEVVLAYIYVYNHSISGYKRIPENLQPYTADWENSDLATK